MKYTELTQEQEESITPYLREMFETTQKYYSSYDKVEIKGYQQAQKAEIENLESRYRYTYDDYDKARIDKLKFESELE